MASGEIKLRRIDGGPKIAEVRTLTILLALDRVRRVEAVMRVMDGTPDRGPEAPRADVAMITVLTMAWAFGDSWRDTTVDETVRTLDRGHAQLTSAIQGAGLSTRD
jgi:hypothetical protein